MLVKPSHSIANIIKSCIKYRKKLAKKKSGLLGPTKVPLEIECFGLTIRKKQTPIKLLNTSLVSSCRFTPEQVLWLHPKLLDLRVCIINGNNKSTITLKPDSHSSIREVIAKIRSTQSGLPENFGLFYKSNGREMPMGNDRCLLFYRLMDGEELIYQQIREKTYDQTLETLVQGTSDVMVCVECPHLGIVKKMRVKKDAAFAEILSRFAEKNAIGELGDYEIFVKGSGSPCNPIFRLGDFVKAATCNLEIRKTAESLPSFVDDSPKENQFGGFLGSGKDENGYIIPQVLIDFYSFLKMEDGFKTEGIFRITGSSILINDMLSEMSDATQYRMGGNIHQWGVHEVATLIKKWFLCMPTRLFSSLTDVQLRMCAENTPERIYTLLDGTTKSLYHWVVNLLTQVALHPESKMDPFNLGLVFAPCVACEDNVSLASQVTLTKYAAAILEKCILQRKKDILTETKNNSKGRRKPPSRIGKRSLQGSEGNLYSRSRGFIVLQAPPEIENATPGSPRCNEISGLALDVGQPSPRKTSNSSDELVRSSSESSLTKMMA